MEITVYISQIQIQLRGLINMHGTFSAEQTLIVVFDLGNSKHKQSFHLNITISSSNLIVHDDVSYHIHGF